MRSVKILVLALLFAGTALSAAPLFHASFQPGQWNEADFLAVKSFRWPNIGKFVQEKDHLVNLCPKDASPEEMLSKRAPETYAAILYRVPLTGKHTVKATASFDYRMAPAIVIADKPDYAAAVLYPELRNHYEIVFYDGGLNIWRHWFVDGKQIWKKAGFLNVRFERGKPCTVTVEVKPTARGTMLTVSAGGHSFGIIDGDVPKTYYAGIIASEGVNRFYDFTIE